MAKIKDSFQKMLKVKGPLRLEVETGSGDIEVRRGEEGRLLVRGEFQVRARSEEARKISARIVEDPPIGDIRVAHVRGGGEAEAGSGDIVAESAIGDRVKWELEASSGDVRLRLPRDSRLRWGRRSKAKSARILLP